MYAINTALITTLKQVTTKANRTSINGKRGVGLVNTMKDFRQIKKTLGVKTLTDVHSVEDLEILEEWHSNAVDVYQIPAFLCRQTDLIQAACSTNKIVNIKKGQFLAPWDVAGILSKCEDPKKVWITEREELALDIIPWLLILPALIICLILILCLLCWTPRTVYKNLAVTELAAVGIGLMCVAYVVQLVPWVLVTFF